MRTLGRRARGNSLHSSLRRGLRVLAGGDLSRPEACLVPARVCDCSARGLVGIGTTVPGRSVTPSARDRRTVKSYLDMQVCLAYSTALVRCRVYLTARACLQWCGEGLSWRTAREAFCRLEGKGSSIEDS